MEHCSGDDDVIAVTITTCCELSLDSTPSGQVVLRGPFRREMTLLMKMAALKIVLI